MAKKVVGYVISVFGILVMTVGFRMIDFGWEILNIVNLDYVAGAGLALVGIGVFVSLMDKGIKRKKGGEDEIPIYEGVGKSRRIVGYRKG